MSLVLYCKNKPVFNIEKQEILNKDLLPGYIRTDPSIEGYNKWLEKKYSTETNSLARILKLKSLGHGKRALYDEKTHILSFSDCYWVKDSEDKICFEEISPYYNNFFTGEKEYNGESIPTLYTPGAKPKEWRENGNLYKADSNIELEAYAVCVAAGVPCNKIVAAGEGIEISNLTNENIMLEQLDMSGAVNIDKFTEEDVIRIFGFKAVQMYTIDAILGNCDRHEGNIAFLRNANTGEYLGLSPLYDFDYTRSDKGNSIHKTFFDYLKYVNKEDIKEVYRICNDVCKSERVDYIYKERAQELQRYL